MRPSLCEFCLHMKEIISGKGARFVLCQKSSVEKRLPKYPPQPVIHCDGFDGQDASEGVAE